MTDDAVRDLLSLYDYLEAREGPTRADAVLHQIELQFNPLATAPQRGAYPKELLDLGTRAYREVFFKPYRILYQITDKRVDVVLVADGRRDMRSLLLRRLMST